MATPTVPVTKSQHHWVRWSLQDVGVIVDPFTGECSAYDLPEAAVGTMVGCHTCGEPLTDSSVQTECIGEESPPSL